MLQYAYSVPRDQEGPMTGTSILCGLGGPGTGETRYSSDTHEDRVCSALCSVREVIQHFSQHNQPRRPIQVLVTIFCRRACTRHNQSSSQHYVSVRSREKLRSVDARRKNREARSLAVSMLDMSKADAHLAARNCEQFWRSTQRQSRSGASKWKRFRRRRTVQ